MDFLGWWWVNIYRDSTLCSGPGNFEAIYIWYSNLLLYKFMLGCQVYIVSEVPESAACSIANAICTELELGNSDSADLLTNMKRLHDTGHPSRVFENFANAQLIADFRESFVDINWKHPVVRPRDMLDCLSRNGKLEHFVKDTSLKEYEQFWDRFESLQPDHPISKLSRERRRHTIPVAVHADEGTSQKKRPLMVVNLQPVIGNGTSYKGKFVNFLGNSLVTRFLYTTIMGRCYRKKRAWRLTKLIDSLAADLKDVFENPVCVSCQKHVIFF